jgi:hypothetical protein
MVSSEELIGTAEYLTLQTSCHVNRCRYNRVRLCVCVCVCVCVNRFRRHGDIKRLRHLSFRRYQSMKSPDDFCV